MNSLAHEYTERNKSKIYASTFALVTFYFTLFCARAFLGGTSIGNVPIILLCGLFIITTVKYVHKNSTQMVALLGCLFLGICSVSVGIFRDGYGPSDMIGDLSTLIRGPIMLLWVWMVAKRSPDPDLSARLLKFCWYCVSGLIVLSAITGFGLNTYEAFSSGWKFFFVSNNELTFCYSFLTGTLVLRSSFRQTALYLATSAIVLLIIGTKSGFIGIAILCFVLSLRVLRRMNRTLGLTYVFLINFTLFFIIFFADLEALISFILPIFSLSSGYEKMVEKISYVGFWDGLLSGRGRFMTFAALEFLNGNNLFDYLFGMGFSDLKGSFGEEFGRNSFIEVDVFDILLSYGLLGVFAYFSLIFYIFRRWLKELAAMTDKSEIYLFVALSILIIGNLSGHVIFSAWATSTIGLVLGSLEARATKSAPNNYVPFNPSTSEETQCTLTS